MQQESDRLKDDRKQRSVRKPRLAKATMTPVLGIFESRSTQRIRELKEKALKIYEQE